VPISLIADKLMSLINGCELRAFSLQTHFPSAEGRIPAHPGNSWIFPWFLGLRTFLKIGLVLESSGNWSLRSWKMEIL